MTIASPRYALRRIREISYELFVLGQVMQFVIDDLARDFRFFVGSERHLDKEKLRTSKIGTALLNMISRGGFVFNRVQHLHEQLNNVEDVAVALGIPRERILRANAFGGNELVLEQKVRKVVKRKAEELRTLAYAEVAVNSPVSNHDLEKRVLRGIEGSSRREAESLWGAAVALNPRLGGLSGSKHARIVPRSHVRRRPR